MLTRNSWGFKETYGEEADKRLYVHWNMPIDVMKVEVGAHFKFNPDIDDYKPPVDIGIGFRYGSPWGDAFWLSARVGMSIGTAEKSPSNIGFQLCPSIDLDIFRLYVPLGIGLVVQEDEDAVFAWSFNPYIRKAMGGIEFWAGFKLYSGTGNVDGNQWQGLNKDNAEVIKWAIPIAFLWAW